MQIDLKLFCLYSLDDEEMAGMVAGNKNDATLFDLSVQINLFYKYFGLYWFLEHLICHNPKLSYFISLNLDDLIFKNI